MIIVGCPCRNDLNCTQMMVNSLFNSTQSFDELVFVDGDSTDGTKEYLNYLSKVNTKIKIIEANTKTPLEAYNILFDYAKNKEADLLLTQTDVVFTRLFRRDWLLEMHNICKDDENVGAVVPYNGTGISGSDYIDGFKWLGGWCTYIPFRILEKIGGYDSNFPNGFGVDIDYTMKIIKLNKKMAMTDYFVDHHMANSREHDNHPDTEQMKQDSAKYFRQKWKLGEFR